MTDPDKDRPEATPCLCPIWSRGSIASFSPLPHIEPVVVVVPFPLSLAIDGERGALLAGLWADGETYAPVEALTAARLGMDGFRLAEKEVT